MLQACRLRPPVRWLLLQPQAPSQPPSRQIVFNGSHSVHGVSEDGATVASADGAERLRIRPHDAFLLVGRPPPPPPLLPCPSPPPS